MAKKGKQNDKKKPDKMSAKAFDRELAKLEVELVKLQGWIKREGLKVAVVFEGRDSAGKGGSDWALCEGSAATCSRSCRDILTWPRR